MVALGVAESLGVEGKEGGVDELSEAPAASSAPRPMNRTTILSQVFRERNFFQIFFK